MKICPTCRRTYEDDGLNFCLEDGSVLTFTSGDTPTVVMEQPRPTNPTPPGTGIPTRLDVQNAPAYSMQPKKNSSRAWIWVLAIFAVLILVCGGGFAGFFFYVASVANANANLNKGTTNTTTAKANTFTRASPSPSPAESTEVKEVNLADWVDEPTVWLETQFEDGEFFMTSKQKGYYYVLVAKDDTVSDSPVARVLVRNPDNGDTSLGYGLVFHSDMTPLANDYAFLIDAKLGKYRVIRHSSEQEKTITAWTTSNLIKQGAEPNLLEARDKGDKIELYINGQLATSITNKQGPTGGVPGLYVGDGAKIGFKKLEVLK